MRVKSEGEKVVLQLMKNPYYRDLGVPVDVIRTEFRKRGLKRSEMQSAKYSLGLKTIKTQEFGQDRWRWKKE